jgi:hypothetical protein
MPDAHMFLTNEEAKWTMKPESNYTFRRGNNTDTRS